MERERRPIRFIEIEASINILDRVRLGKREVRICEITEVRFYSDWDVIATMSLT